MLSEFGQLSETSTEAVPLHLDHSLRFDRQTVSGLAELEVFWDYVNGFQPMNTRLHPFYYTWITADWSFGRSWSVVWVSASKDPHTTAPFGATRGV